MYPSLSKYCKYGLRRPFTNFSHCLTTYFGISSYPAENVPSNFFITHSPSISVIGYMKIESGQYLIFD